MMTSQGSDKTTAGDLDGTGKREKKEKVEKSPIRERRYGQISIGTDMWHEPSNDEMFSALFGQFFPAKAGYSISRDAFIYEGYCKQFDILSENDQIPRYEISASKERLVTGLGSYIKVTFERKG